MTPINPEIPLPSIHEIDIEALDALIQRLNDAKDYNLTLSAEDIQLLLAALATLSILQTDLSSHDVTIHKLRKLLGIVVASETLSTLLNKKQTSTSKKPKSRKKNNTEKPNTIKPNVEHHPLETLSKGDLCPECKIGTLSKVEPGVLLRITGHSPYEGIRHIMERLRCNACGQYFTADLPDEVKADGDSHQKYGYSARSIMAINKYFMGSPFYRQETLQDILGVPITASTIYDQCEYLGNDAHPVYKVFLELGANAKHFYLDDTTNRILNQKEIIKAQRKTNKPQKRTGTYTSGVIATTVEGHDIVLFQTNIGHAGEWIDEILQKREPGQAPPIVMSDALSHNRPSKVTVIQAFCNVHARRQFVDVIHQFPQQVEHVLNLYKGIWVNENKANAQSMNDAQRLVHHREHSLPIMAQIREWGEQQLAQAGFEEHSGLGKAIRYFLKHFDALTRFCTVEGAKIDNNPMEAQLKMIARGRKNSSFFKTLAGASVGDVITSVIATCVRAEVSPFDYLNAIQRHQDAVKANPHAWLPWNYHLNL